MSRPTNKLIDKGQLASREYNEILNLPTAQCKQRPTSTRKQRIRKEENQLVNFDKSVLFRAALSDDLKSVSLMKFTGNDVNSCDTFGWTGLMIAACEGSRKVCEFLLHKGCDLAIADRSGNTAMSLAKMKSRTEIVKMIEEKLANTPRVVPSASETSAQPVAYDPFWCEDCQHLFKETSKKSHETSTLHRFNRKNSFEFSRRYFIPDSNVGFKMMLRQGWDREGLGPNSDGKLYPVKTTIRRARSGLGTKQDSARITHYSAYDRDAIKWRPAAPKAKTKKQLEKDSKKNQRKEMAIRRALS
ncbi:G patch domain and ankyrin repeat-containing protein 1 homolog [Bradysia coprophila]|uniref:G patch domain and ankyrin repeat-containing protein 1 homolog n=1 Tax=Bradysia coprophila TaxID=38358 RepID=UPI00187DC0D4|nr:G patch domain and ankyrin repeat-containing protein 1 homolog [Bradysia coprophila]